jgi:hypothetical protein
MQSKQTTTRDLQQKTTSNMNRNKKKAFAILLACAILFPAVGCGSKGPVSIVGTVTVDGKPLERGKIDFQPADNKGPIAAAAIKDGKYECAVMPGKKTIRITGGKVTGQHPFTPGNPSSPMVEDIQSLVPPCYNIATTLTCEIEYGKPTQNFDLKSKP